MTAVAARARGLITTMLSIEALAELDRTTDRAVLARVGVGGDASSLERRARDRVADDLALLVRRSDGLDMLVLDEDRRSLRAIVRGLAGGIAPRQRLSSVVPTPRLPLQRLEALAAAPTLATLAATLASCGHPYASVFARATSPIDLFAIELAMAHRFAELAVGRDRPSRAYLAQLADADNAGAAIAISSRGRDIAVGAAFVTGGQRVTRAIFTTACSGAAPQVLAKAFAGTPIAAALFAPEPGALESATLAWQLATQARLRRIEPLSLAPAIYTVLRRRDEARHLRRAAWRLALGGERP